MKITDVVRVKNSWHSEFCDRYWGCEVHGEKGEIVEVISHNGQIEGYRVKFPAITICGHHRKGKTVENFVWPFRPEDIELVDEPVKFHCKREYRTGSLLKMRKRAVERMRKRGMKIKDIANQMEIPEGTIKRWLYQARKRQKVRSAVG